ncbi:MAG TPA: hypothetical protein VEV17_15520 [Bryobacteraceae bacterium]|nr:hypothetical protein [Bryobacteraceae bacterium]
MLAQQARAIVWAQWRTTRNYFPRSNKGGAIFSGVMALVWYGAFAYLAAIAAFLLSKPEEFDAMHQVLPDALLLCFLYWQLIPVLMASMGSSLDIRKLLVYPIPNRELFALEVMLRASTAGEMLLLLIGAAVGLWLNPGVPRWAPLGLLPFILLNLLCSAGVRDLLVRLLARRRVREIVVFLLVLSAALPQLLLATGTRFRWRQLFAGETSPVWPWTAAARLSQGEFSWLNIGVLAAWTTLAYVFGRWQFERGLRFDSREAAATSAPSTRSASRLEWWYTLPNVIFRDPLAGLIEKELRFLSRAPRFRLVFVMGFSFGLLVWAPIAFGRLSSRSSLISDNFLTFVSVYALLLLSDVLFWNCFGFDRSAMQLYFLAPLKMSTVLLGKNLAAVSFVLLEITGVATVCALLRLPLSPLKILEAFSVTCVVTLLILSIGNLSSLYNPRPVNPSKSFRTSASGRTQAMLMLAFPIALLPVALAFLARYAFDSEWALFGVLLVGAALGAIVYRYSMSTAVEAAQDRRERIIATLSQGEGPIEN